jgi:4-amino-4-deoxy-L-arabinose transferase-like glycosyltransferase
MHTLQVVSDWLKAINPFLAAVLSVLKAYDVHEKKWKFLGGILSALLLFVTGCAAVYFRIHS